MKHFIATLFRMLLIATFALWFGGFTFYVSFVIPIGTEILGSARSQGFITQQVTHWLNLVCAGSLVMMTADSIRGFRLRSTRALRIESVLLFGIGLLLVGLVWIHPTLDRMIDASAESITDETRFYGIHRIYLWLSTFQWIMAWCWLLLVVDRWTKESQFDVEPA